MSAIIYAVVEQSGVINSIYSSPYQFIQCGEEVSDTTHYVDMATLDVKEKAPFEYALHVHGLTVILEGLPAGVTVSANAMQVLTDSEPTEIAFDVPGTYSITFSEKVEYLDHTVNVTVEPLANPEEEDSEEVAIGEA